MCCGADQPTTSRYDTDPRVTRDGDTFTVTTAEPAAGPFHIRHTGVFAWVICHDDQVGTFLQTSSGFAIGIATADAAIGALIGDPVVAR